MFCRVLQGAVAACRAGERVRSAGEILPFTFWTDLDNRQPPFVEVTEGGCSRATTAR